MEYIKMTYQSQIIKSFFSLCAIVIVFASASLCPVSSQSHISYNSQFGDNQMRKMLIDRPELTKLIGIGDPIWKWGAAQYSGGSLGEPFYWSNEENLSGKSKEYQGHYHAPIKGKEPGYICIRKYDKEGKLADAEDLLDTFVFECNNILNSSKMQYLERLAYAGKLNEQQWIDENVKLEYEAFARTNNVLNKIVGPVVRQRRSAYLTDTVVTPSFSEWLKQYSDPNGYPWSYWGRHYREVILPYRLKNTQTRKY
jgi:hypothetical protein